MVLNFDIVFLSDVVVDVMRLSLAILVEMDYPSAYICTSKECTKMYEFHLQLTIPFATFKLQAV